MAQRGIKIIDPSPSEKKAFEEALAPVYDDVRKWVPKTTVDAIRDAGNRADPSKQVLSRQ